MKIRNLLLAGLAVVVLDGSAVTADLRAVVEQRIAGDRSGVCLVATRIGPSIQHASACADADSARGLDADSRFEIGSISKALQGLLVASLVEDGTIELDQPLSELLPEGQKIPAFAGEVIRLRHLLTHTAGLPRLPPDFAPEDMNNPYAELGPADLLASLAHSELESAPGERFAYSNFGATVLSLALVEHTGKPLSDLFQQHVFDPLGMDRSSMDGPTVTGHDANGSAVSNWDFHSDLGGVGAIRSTPADMARWLAGLLDPESTTIGLVLNRSREVLIEVNGQKLGYGWLHLPVNDGFVLAHDGGTGGFSSFAAADPESRRASLVLMDTSMLMQGSLGDLAYHLIDETYPLGSPRQPSAAAPGERLEDYAGRFALYDEDEPFMGDFTLDITVVNNELMIQGSVGGQQQPRFPLDSEGDGRFVEKTLDVTIQFTRDDDGQVDGLDFTQGPFNLRGRPL